MGNCMGHSQALPRPHANVPLHKVRGQLVTTYPNNTARTDPDTMRAFGRDPAVEPAVVAPHEQPTHWC